MGKSLLGDASEFVEFVFPPTAGVINGPMIGAEKPVTMVRKSVPWIRSA